MRETFLIDGERVDVDIRRRSHSIELLEVTSFIDKHVRYIQNGFQFVRIEGKSIYDDMDVDDIFQVLSRENDVLVLSSLVENHELKFMVR